MADSLLDEYLTEFGGDTVRYWQCLGSGQRVGQAFFNALSEEDQEALRGTVHDPFYAETYSQTEKAIDFLLSREN